MERTELTPFGYAPASGWHALSTRRACLHGANKTHALRVLRACHTASPHPARRGGSTVRNQVANRPTGALGLRTRAPTRRAGWGGIDTHGAALVTNLRSTPASGVGADRHSRSSSVPTPSSPHPPC